MGSHVFNDMVAPRIVALTVNKAAIIRTMSSQFERDLTSGSQPMGDSERIKLPNMSTIRDGFSYVGAAIDRRYKTLVASERFGSDMDWDTIEKAVKMERSAAELEENLFEPQAERISSEWEIRGGRFIKLHCKNVVGALGTVPTTLLTYTGVRTRIMELGGWESASRRSLFLTPNAMGTVIASSNNVLALFNPTRQIDDAFQDGYVGQYSGFKWIESMNLPPHTTGVITTQATGTTVSGGGQSGTSILLGGTTGNTLLPGDIVTFANVNEVNPMTKQSIGRLYQGKILIGGTFASSLLTVTLEAPGIVPTGPYQNVDAGPAAGAIVLLWPGTTMVDATAKSGTCGFAFTDKAVGFTSIKLPMPKSGTQEMTDQYTDPKTGMSIGLWRTANFQDRSFSTRLDTWGGFVNLDLEHCGVLIGM